MLQITPEQLHQLKEYTGKRIARIAGCVGDDAGEVIGSGTLIEVKGQPYLLTAEHVWTQQYETDAKGDRLYNGLSYCGYAEGPFYRITNRMLSYPHPRDIAVAQVFQEDAVRGAQEPTKWHDMPKFTPKLEGEILFVHGYPGKYSQYFRLCGGIVSRDFPWIATEEPCNCGWFDRATHVAIGYPVRGTDARGPEVDLPDPKGLSGSGLWRTNIVAKGSSWKPEDVQLVGVIIEWDPESKTLIATKIEHVRTLVLLAIQQADPLSPVVGVGIPE